MERVELAIPPGIVGKLRFFLRDLPRAIAAMRKMARERGCDKKVKHRTFEGALAHAIRLNKRDNGLRFEPYSCRYCDHWHVGRTADSPRDGAA